jgi:hypothetical protein
MEGLAIASGVAGLLSLTIEVCRISAKYINGIRGATEAVQALLRELKALEKALMNLDELVESIDDETIFGTRSSALLSVEDAREYREALERLRQKLLERLTSKSFAAKMKTLTWPFSEETTRGIVGMLHNHLTIFQNALCTDIL